MLNRFVSITTALIALLCMNSLFAQTQQPQPTVDSLLDQIEIKAREIKSYEAFMRLDQIEGLLGDQQIWFGKLYYVTDPQIKFAVDFQKHVVNNQLQVKKRQWVYDGVWLVERLDDKKQFFKRQIHSPEDLKKAAHDNVDPMAMENNPFPIPLRAKKAEVLKRFTVELITTKSDLDPQDAAFYHLKLIPKPSSQIDFTEVNLWYDKTTLLPLKCQTNNDDSGNESIFTLTKAVLNQPIAPEMLSTQAPTDRGWHVEITPLQATPQQ